MTAAFRVRRSIQDIQDDYAKGNKEPLEALMRAWKGIKELPPDDPRSFFALGFIKIRRRHYSDRVIFWCEFCEQKLTVPRALSRRTAMRRS